MSESDSTAWHRAGLFDQLQLEDLPGAGQLADALLGFPKIRMRADRATVTWTFDAGDESAVVDMTIRLTPTQRLLPISESELSVARQGRPIQIHWTLDADRARGIARALCRYELAVEESPTEVRRIVCAILRDEAEEDVARHGPFTYLGGHDRDWAEVVSARGADVRCCQAANLPADVADRARFETARLIVDAAVQDPGRTLLLSPGPGDAILVGRALRAYPGKCVVLVGEHDDAIGAPPRPYWKEERRIKLYAPDAPRGHVSILRRRPTIPARSLGELCVWAKRMQQTGAPWSEVDRCLMELQEATAGRRDALIATLTQRNYSPGLFAGDLVPASGKAARTRVSAVFDAPADAAALATAVESTRIPWAHPVLEDLECDDLAKDLAMAAEQVRRLLLCVQP